LPALLRLAASAGSRDAVEHYLRRGQDVNATDARGRTLLLIAAGKGHEHLCRLLVEADADTSLRDSEGTDALSAAIRNGHGEAEAVLRASVSPAIEGSADSPWPTCCRDHRSAGGLLPPVTIFCTSRALPKLDTPR